MSVEKYYQQYLKGEEIKKIVEKYASNHPIQYKLLPMINRLLIFTKLFEQKASSVIKDHTLQEIVSKALLLQTAASKMLDSILLVAYSNRPNESPGKVVVDKNIVKLSYKKYSIELEKCRYDEWSKKASDDIIISELMDNDFSISQNTRLEFLIPDNVHNMLNDIIKKHKIKNVYDIGLGFHRLTSYKHYDCNVYLRTIRPELSAGFGKSSNIFATDYESDSLIIIDFISLKILQFYLLENILQSILKNKTNITIVVSNFYLTHQPGIYTLQYPSVTKQYDNVYKTTKSCESITEPGGLVVIRYISNDENIIKYIDDHEKQDD